MRSGERASVVAELGGVRQLRARHMKISATLSALFGLTLLVAADEKSAISSPDFAAASTLEIQAFHAGDIRGIRAVSKVYKSPSLVFEILAASIRVDAPPSKPIGPVAYGTLTIGGQRYRITVPTSLGTDWRLFFNVAPESDPNRFSYFSLGLTRGEKLCRIFAPP